MILLIDVISGQNTYRKAKFTWHIFDFLPSLTDDSFDNLQTFIITCVNRVLDRPCLYYLYNKEVRCGVYIIIYT